MNPTLILVICIVPAALFVLWPLFTSEAQDPMEAIEEDPLAVLEGAKNNAYAAIKEAEFDRRTGKLSEEDYESLVRRYKDQALEAIAALDHQQPAAPAASAAAVDVDQIRFCPACGTKKAPGANYCGGCGTALRAA